MLASLRVKPFAKLPAMINDTENGSLSNSSCQLRNIILLTKSATEYRSVVCILIFESAICCIFKLRNLQWNLRDAKSLN